MPLAPLQCFPNRRGALGWNDGAGRDGAGLNPLCGGGAACGSPGFAPLPNWRGLWSAPGSRAPGDEYGELRYPPGLLEYCEPLNPPPLA